MIRTYAWIYAFFSALDYITTMLALRFPGVYEKNPLMALVVDDALLAGIAKAAGTLFAVGIAYTMQYLIDNYSDWHHRWTDRLYVSIATGVVFGVVLFQMVIVYSNTFILFELINWYGGLL